MRKKLGTRFPASRIKKIMQADEDIGKIAMAVPLLVSKALELFLQDLCDRTYEITLQRGAKTMNSLHLKQCIKSYNVFDFLTHVVHEVPTLGESHPIISQEKDISRRRKILPNDQYMDADEDRKVQKTMTRSPSLRGRGRGRGRSRGRPPLNRTNSANAAVSDTPTVDTAAAVAAAPVLDSTSQDEDPYLDNMGNFENSNLLYMPPNKLDDDEDYDE